MSEKRVLFGWCQSGHHISCRGFVPQAPERPGPLRCSCSCHDDRKEKDR